MTVTTRTRSGAFSRAAAAARRAVAISLVAVLVAAGCSAGPAGRPAADGPVSTPPPTPTTAVSLALVQVNGALRAAGLVAVERPTSVRPAEPASFFGVPRWAFSVPLAGDLDGARFVVYQFASADAAVAAATDLADYLRGGSGRVQYLPDTRFVVRLVGSTVLFYPWSAENAADANGARLVATAIATVGTEITVRP